MRLWRITSAQFKDVVIITLSEALSQSTQVKAHSNVDFYSWGGRGFKDSVPENSMLSADEDERNLKKDILVECLNTRVKGEGGGCDDA